VCAATAVNNLNANTFGLGHVKEKTVAATGIVVFIALLTMLIEAVIIAMRFLTKEVFSVPLVSCFSYQFSPPT